LKQEVVAGINLVVVDIKTLEVVQVLLPLNK
jgi:hypothetical protein